VAIYGQPNKAGKSRRDTPSDRPRGRTIAQRVGLVAIPVRDAEPIGTALMASLGIASATGSPMSSGSGFSSQATGAGITGRDARRTGALQTWQGAGAPVGRDGRRAVIGVQGGPGDAPAYPSTGNNVTPSISDSLGMMSLPGVLRTPAVR